MQCAWREAGYARETTGGGRKRSEGRERLDRVIERISGDTLRACVSRASKRSIDGAISRSLCAGAGEGRASRVADARLARAPIARAATQCGICDGSRLALLPAKMPRNRRTEAKIHLSRRSVVEEFNRSLVKVTLGLDDPFKAKDITAQFTNGRRRGPDTDCRRPGRCGRSVLRRSGRGTRRLRAGAPAGGRRETGSA